MTVEIVDVETDNFLEDMTRIWTIQIGNAESDEVTVYADQPGYPSLKEGLERLEKADWYVFHNGLRFDLFAINKVFPGSIDPERVWDSLVVARLLHPDMTAHSLDAWGSRLNVRKDDFNDFSRFSREMVEYGRQDVEVTRALYHHLQKKQGNWDWSKAFALEFRFQYAIALQEQNGFMLDKKAACELEAELRQELADIGINLQEVFPPRFVAADKTVDRSYRENEKKITTWLGLKRKSDNPALWEKFKGEKASFPYTKVSEEIFNPSSRKQVASRLKHTYGWKPWKFTQGGDPCVDEETLSELPWPEAKEMLRYLTVEKQLGQIINKAGDKGWLLYVNEDTDRVHGAVNTVGAATGRCSHFAPNMAQVNKRNKRMRSCWIPRPGWKLVGVDADGLEFACLGHYITPLDGGTTVSRIMEGDKSQRTDVHSANVDAVVQALRDHGFKFEDPSDDVLKALREHAKTLIYALMYGASDPKLGVTVQEMMDLLGVKSKKSVKSLGEMARKALGKGIPGLDKLIDGVKKKARKKKYVKGIDGRKIRVRSEHSAFNFLLQGAGAIAMKQALVIFHFEKLPDTGWVHGEDFGYCANVHDEVQIECRPEIAEHLGELFADSIREAGERLGFRCPLSASYDVGDNWAETH